jgi:serine-type D-Ala-D-Ala carboxypeptidase (penicillin-binding protein 5/6)
MTTQQDADDALSPLDALLSDERYPDDHRVDPAVRRARRRRGLLVFGIVVVVLLAAVGGYAGWALNAPLPAPVADVRQPGLADPVPAVLALPAEGSSAVAVTGADEFLGDGASGVWTTSGSGDPRPLASLTKLVTALVILDARPLEGADAGPTITFSDADHDLYDEYYVQGATIAAMPAGSAMSLRDALAVMLVPSASNYAEAVSTWAFGSQGAFLGAARSWLAENGLTATTIVEPTGLSARNTASPADALALAKLAAAHPVVAEIAGTRSISLPTTGVLHNTNGLLGTAGITGLKTGNLGAGTFNLAYTASIELGFGEPVRITGVVLGGGSRDEVGRDVVRLLDSIRDGFRLTHLIDQGRELGTYTTAWGSSATLVVGESASIRTWSDTPITREMDVVAPTSYEDGEVVGSITWTAGPRTATTTLEVEGSLEPPTDWWRLTHPGELGGRAG